MLFFSTEVRATKYFYTCGLCPFASRIKEGIKELIKRVNKKIKFKELKHFPSYLKSLLPASHAWTCWYYHILLRTLRWFPAFTGGVCTYILYVSVIPEKALGKSKDLRNTNLIKKAFRNNANFSTTPFCSTMNFKPGYWKKKKKRLPAAV